MPRHEDVEVELILQPLELLDNAVGMSQQGAEGRGLWLHEVNEHRKACFGIVDHNVVIVRSKVGRVDINLLAAQFNGRRSMEHDLRDWRVRVLRRGDLVDQIAMAYKLCRIRKN